MATRDKFVVNLNRLEDGDGATQQMDVTGSELDFLFQKGLVKIVPTKGNSKVDIFSALVDHNSPGAITQ